MRCLSLAVIVSLLLGLAACSTVDRSNVGGLRIHMIKVVNQSAGDIDDFRLEVPTTGGVVATNRILKSREFSNGVPPFPYKGNSVTIRWQQDGRPYSAGMVRVAEIENPGHPVTALIAIGDHGRFSIYFE